MICTLSGCANDGKSSAINTDQMMSKEEMDQLVDGQTVMKDPDQEYLESKDMIALYRYKVKTVFEDGEVRNQEIYYHKRKLAEEEIEDSVAKWTEYREFIDITIHKVDLYRNNPYGMVNGEHLWEKEVDGIEAYSPVLTEEKRKELEATGKQEVYPERDLNK